MTFSVVLLRLVTLGLFLKVNTGLVAKVDGLRVQHHQRAFSLLSTPVSTFESSATATEASSAVDAGAPPLPYLAERRPLKTGLLALAARTCRGEIGSAEEREQGLQLCSNLETYNPTDAPATSELILGTWELVWASTYLFKSSPFFLAARAVCAEGPEADRFNLFCRLHREALAFTNIGKVTQTVTPTSLVSEFQTSVAVLPGLPVVVKGTIQSSAEISSRTDDLWTLYMDKVRIKSGSSNVPVLSGLLDGFQGLDSRALSSVLEAAISLKSPRPVVRCTYVDTHMRIFRDQDGEAFCWNRVG